MAGSSILSDAPIAFIGAGAMGEAMIGGLLRRNLLEPEAITASDLDQERLDGVQAQFGVRRAARRAPTEPQCWPVRLAQARKRRRA